MIPGLGQPRVLRGNTRTMTTLRPALGTYFLNDDTAHVHQWTGDGWESIGGSGTPQISDLLKQLQGGANPGSGSSPGVRATGDPSIDDPTIFVPPPTYDASVGLTAPVVYGAGGGDDPLLFDTVLSDPLAMWSAVNWWFVVPVAGVYLCRCRCLIRLTTGANPIFPAPRAFTLALWSNLDTDLETSLTDTRIVAPTTTVDYSLAIDFSVTLPAGGSVNAAVSNDAGAAGDGWVLGPNSLTAETFLSISRQTWPDE